MKLFRRNKQVDSNLPPEIQAYARGEHRERVGVAWLVGLISLIVTFLVVAGLYFGGRWIYRKLAHKDSSSATPTAQTEKPTSDKKEDAAKGQTKTKDDTQNGSRTETPVQAPAPAATPTPNTPVTGDNSEDTLVRTGPDVDL